VSAAAAPAPSHEPLALLSAQGIGKRFGGVQALSEVSFTINHGEIYGLIGPNGAGKTTLFNVLTGIYDPDGGSFNVRRPAAQRLKPHEVAARGIARTFQNIRLFANLSALENVMVGPPRAHQGGRLGRDRAQPAHARRGGRDREAVARAARVRRRRVARERLAKNLPYGFQRRLEIARALATEPKLLALDEPAAGMNATETQSLEALLHDIRRDGTTIL
jgi:branched-chain amino acid transport system ATP-binding protein